MAQHETPTIPNAAVAAAVVATAVVADETPDYHPALMTWDDLQQGADQVLGFDLAKDALFDALAKVPFIITKVTFRKGSLRNSKQWAYASCEAVIAPEAVLKKRRIPLDTLPFEPDSMVVFNDGSTGVYRQIVAYLAATQKISLPDEMSEVGAFGESKYDLPPIEWADIHVGESHFDSDGWLNYEVNVRLSCPRGIRLSEYQNDYTQTGKTRYLA